jgi:hypothetical protein
MTMTGCKVSIPGLLVLIAYHSQTAAGSTDISGLQTSKGTNIAGHADLHQQAFAWRDNSAQQAIIRTRMPKNP